MSYVEKSLLPGEEIIVQGRIHWIALVLPMIMTFVVFLLLLACVGLVLTDIPDLARLGAGLVGVFLLLAFLGGVVGMIDGLFSYFIGEEAAVTSRRVILKSGVIRRKTMEIAHSQIESIALDQGLVDRLAGAGQVKVLGAGSGWVQTALLANYEDFRRAALERIGEARGK